MDGMRRSQMCCLMMTGEEGISLAVVLVARAELLVLWRPPGTGPARVQHSEIL